MSDTRATKMEKDLALHNSNLHELLAPGLSVLGFRLVACRVLSSGCTRTLRLDISKADTAVTAEDCAQATYQVRAVLRAHLGRRFTFPIEVSSVGA